MWTKVISLAATLMAVIALAATASPADAYKQFPMSPHKCVNLPTLTPTGQMTYVRMCVKWSNRGRRH